MNCKYCSEPLEDGVTLCPACGKDNAEAVEPAQEAAPEEGTVEPVPQAENSQTETPVEEESSQDAQEEEEAGDPAETSQEEAPEESEQKPARKSKKRIVLIVTAVAALLALALGLEGCHRRHDQHDRRQRLLAAQGEQCPIQGQLHRPGGPAECRRRQDDSVHWRSEADQRAAERLLLDPGL